MIEGVRRHREHAGVQGQGCGASGMEDSVEFG
jgi:hypothetical protein